MWDGKCQKTGQGGEKWAVDDSILFNIRQWDVMREKKKLWWEMEYGNENEEVREGHSKTEPSVTNKWIRKQIRLYFPGYIISSKNSSIKFLWSIFVKAKKRKGAVGLEQPMPGSTDIFSPLYLPKVIYL